MKNFQNGFLKAFVIVICAIIIIGIVAIMFLSWQTRQALNEARNPTSQTQPVVLNSSSSTNSSASITVGSPSTYQWKLGKTYSVPISSTGIHSVYFTLSSVLGNHSMTSGSPIEVNLNGASNISVTVPTEFSLGEARLLVWGAGQNDTRVTLSNINIVSN